MSQTGVPVELYVYDLSQGMARQMSPMLLGKTIEAVYHTGIVVYGTEYFFGGGIQTARPGCTVAGTPYEKTLLGYTTVSQADFVAFLRRESHKFTAETYDLMTHNCNNFSNHCSKFLLNGTTIPSKILDLPGEFFATPLGQMIRPMIEGTQQQMRSQGAAATAAGLASPSAAGASANSAPMPLGAGPASAAGVGVGAGYGGAPPTATGTAPSAAASVSAPAAAAIAAAAGAAGASAGLPPPVLPPTASTHADLPLAFASRPPPTVSDTASLSSMSVLLKASLRKPTVAKDPTRAFSPDESAAVHALIKGLPAVAPAAADFELVGEALPPLLRAAGTWDTLSLLPLCTVLANALLSPEANDVVASLPTPLPCVDRLAAALGNAADAADAQSQATETVGGAATSPGGKDVPSAKAATAAMFVLTNLANLPAAAPSLASTESLLPAVSRLLSHPSAPVRTSAAYLLASLARALLAPPAQAQAAATAATATAGAAAGTAVQERGALTDAQMEAFIAAASALAHEKDPLAAAAELRAVAELCYEDHTATELLEGLDVEPAAVAAAHAGKGAVSGEVRALAADVALMVALTKKIMAE